MGFIKQAQECDAAGRIMARGFYDEFCKLAMSAPASVTGDDKQKLERKGVSEGAPGKRPAPPKGAGDGKGPGAPSTHLLMGE